ncbi:MAG TPA: hypothetical protein VFS53_03280 [Gemmatimonadota bacterium]|nr:hypothetical protein [Gemmatimonadota bacterium]
MTAEIASAPPTPARSNRPLWIAIGVLSLLLIATYAWKVASVNRLEDRLAERERLWEEGARHAVEQNARSMLGLAAVPLGLSAREEAMSRNYGLMQERFERMLREPGVERVLYATAGDSIAVSTDRSLIGKPLSSAIPERYSRPVGTNVVVEEGAYQAIVPITGLNERLGVVILTYRQPRIDAGRRASPHGQPADSTST